MEESFMHLRVAFVANYQAAKVSQPGKGAFDFPAATVTAQRTSISSGGLFAAPAMRANQLDVPGGQMPPQRVAVVTQIGNEPLNFPPQFGRHAGERVVYERDFRRVGLDQSHSQRNTLAVDHHHPLRALVSLGFAHSLAPFLAGAKLPSINASLQSSFCRWSSSARKARQILSQISSSSQSCKRRQQVLGLGYSRGKSRQRAPVLSTHRIPSSTCRLSCHGRPRLRSFGNRGSIFFHCSSDKNGFGIPSFSQTRRKSTKYLYYLHKLIF